jgi:hypothetical protein
MGSRNKQGFALMTALAILIIIWSFRFFGPDRQVVRDKVVPYAKTAYSSVVPQQTIQTVDLTHLEKYIKTDEFEYARRTIKTKYFTGERPTTTRINETLFGDLRTMSKASLEDLVVDDLKTLELPVPCSPQVDQSIMSFAIATKVDRLDRSDQLLHWLPNTGAQLHVMATPALEAYEVEQRMRDHGVNVTIHDSDLPFAKAYFYGIKQLYETRTPETKWIVLMDDDTFFPSLPYFVQHLNKHYDASEEIMVAAMSDSMDQVKIFGPIPFGGGGIFISVPLAASLVKDEVWNRCMETTHNQGDGIVSECLNAHSAIRPTFDIGLNQMDIGGNPSGYFESGRRMLTIHHWKTWFQVDIPMAANVSKACGFECLFQRFRFDDNIVLSNGYSVVEYPGGMEDKDGNVLVDLDQVEKTWDGAMVNYEHHIGPLREAYEPHEKRSMKLVETSFIPGKGVKQIYVENVQDLEKHNTMDRVVELTWLFED